MAVKPVVLALSGAGEATAHRVADRLGLLLHGREGRVKIADAFFANALDHIRDLFASGTPVIGVCASGILIRAVAPLLSDKRAEPPVLSVADDGSVVVPLLGGHRGANQLARDISEVLGAVAAVTTAGDLALGVALDEPPAGWRLANPGAAKLVMSRLLGGGGASVVGEEQAHWLPTLPTGNEVTLRFTVAPCEAGAAELVYHPTRAVLGVGCARNCPPDQLAALAQRALDAAGIAPGALAAIGTLDLKADEPAVLQLAAAFGVPLRLFGAADLEAFAGQLQNPSEVVFREVGCHGVAEGAALALGGSDAVFAQAKLKSDQATCAVVLAPEPIVDLAGRVRGRLSVVGIGPGQAAWRTPEASRLIAEA
ncbi:MAG: cobalamin biosynthesis protein, partial [Paracoccaceae bacterium]